MAVFVKIEIFVKIFILVKIDIFVQIDISVKFYVCVKLSHFKLLTILSIAFDIFYQHLTFISIIDIFIHCL